MANTVTFQTILVPARETPEAVMIFGGRHLPKSQISYVVTGETTREERDRKGKKFQVDCKIVDITMPEWLARG